MSFVTDAHAEGTNHRAERALRPHAMARHRSGGARSDDGAATYTTNTSVTRTCGTQELPFLDASIATQRAHVEDLPFPNLFPREPAPPALPHPRGLKQSPPCITDFVRPKC